MKRSVILVSIALLGGLGMQAADAAPLRHAHISACMARQRADLAPLDSYGGTLPAFAPAIMQQIMNPVIHNIRTRCMPTTNEEDMGWDTNSPSIAPAPQ
jgi:hypothetical protein